MNKNFIAPLELKKNGRPGEFKAMFATLNVVDRDFDWIPPGAFIEGQEAILEPWNHGETLPAGKGTIHSNQVEAWVEGQFFLDTVAGKENYTTVKNLGRLTQWSFTFNVEKSGPAIGLAKQNGSRRMLLKMDTTGISPVTRGAGIDTRTVAIKAKAGDKPKRTWLPLARRKTSQELNAEIDLLGCRLMRESLEEMLSKDARPSPAQMREDVWRIAGHAQGHCDAYLDVILASRREQAWHSFLQDRSRQYCPNWPEIRE